MNTLEYAEQMKLVDKINMGVLSKFPYLGTTLSGLKFEPDDGVFADVNTAGTDGKRVIFNVNFLSSLTYDEQVCLFSHEIMHVAFDHIIRSKDRNHDIWNDATDSVINQMLKGAGLPLPSGGIDMPEAIDMSAEDMYDYLLKQNENNLSKNKDNVTNSAQNGNNIAQNVSKSTSIGSHSMWEGAIKRLENAGSDNTDIQKNDTDKFTGGVLEKNFTRLNEELKNSMASSIMNDLKSHAKDSSLGSSNGRKFKLGDIDDPRQKLSWKKILRRELEKDKDEWSDRRAEEDNYYQSRIESVEVLDQAKTQVMLDTSSSVNDYLLKNFLRQLKPLLKDSDLEVGCFDSEFYGFQKVKGKSDIDNFIFQGRGNTSFETAVKGFSNEKGINKIVFTDGRDFMRLSDKEYKKIIWIVYGNKNFRPKVGRVIFVDEREIIAPHKKENFEREM